MTEKKSVRFRRWKLFLEENVPVTAKENMNYTRALIAWAFLMIVGARTGGGAPPMGSPPISVIPFAPAGKGSVVLHPDRTANEEACEVVRTILLMLPPPASVLPTSADPAARSA
jgi:hypothetical protein